MQEILCFKYFQPHVQYSSICHEHTVYLGMFHPQLNGISMIKYVLHLQFTDEQFTECTGEHSKAQGERGWKGSSEIGRDLTLN